METYRSREQSSKFVSDYETKGTILLRIEMKNEMKIKIFTYITVIFSPPNYEQTLTALTSIFFFL